ncbi:unnamed protein product [Amoebophrya sp. A120]|nr:unnamed protein product [Amoebophrya sp. A120]|eukprot:GSA120T00011194001.1
MTDTEDKNMELNSLQAARSARRKWEEKAHASSPTEVPGTWNIADIDFMMKSMFRSKNDSKPTSNEVDGDKNNIFADGINRHSDENAVATAPEGGTGTPEEQYFSPEDFSVSHQQEPGAKMLFYNEDIPEQRAGAASSASSTSSVTTSKKHDHYVDRNFSPDVVSGPPPGHSPCTSDMVERASPTEEAILFGKNELIGRSPDIAMVGAEISNNDGSDREVQPVNYTARGTSSASSASISSSTTTSKADWSHFKFEVRTKVSPTGTGKQVSTTGASAVAPGDIIKSLGIKRDVESRSLSAERTRRKKHQAILHQHNSLSSSSAAGVHQHNSLSSSSTAGVAAETTNSGTTTMAAKLRAKELENIYGAPSGAARRGGQTTVVNKSTVSSGSKVTSSSSSRPGSRGPPGTRVPSKSPSKDFVENNKRQTVAGAGGPRPASARKRGTSSHNQASGSRGRGQSTSRKEQLPAAISARGAAAASENSKNPTQETNPDGTTAKRSNTRVVLRSAREYLKGLSARSSPEKMPPNFQKRLQELDRGSSKAASSTSSKTTSVAPSVVVAAPPVAQHADHQTGLQLREVSEEQIASARLHVDKNETAQTKTSSSPDDMEESRPPLPETAAGSSSSSSSSSFYKVPLLRTETKEPSTASKSKVEMMAPADETCAGPSPADHDPIKEGEHNTLENLSTPRLFDIPDGTKAGGALEEKPPASPRRGSSRSSCPPAPTLSDENDLNRPSDGLLFSTSKNASEKEKLFNADRFYIQAGRIIDGKDTKPARSTPSPPPATAAQFPAPPGAPVAGSKHAEMNKPRSSSSGSSSSSSSTKTNFEHLIKRLPAWPFPIVPPVPPPPPPLISPQAADLNGWGSSSSRPSRGGFGVQPPQSVTNNITVRRGFVNMHSAVASPDGGPGQSRFRDFAPSIQSLEEQYSRQRTMRPPSSSPVESLQTSGQLLGAGGAKAARATAVSGGGGPSASSRGTPQPSPSQPYMQQQLLLPHERGSKRSSVYNSAKRPRSSPTTSHPKSAEATTWRAGSSVRQHLGGSNKSSPADNDLPTAPPPEKNKPGNKSSTSSSPADAEVAASPGGSAGTEETSSGSKRRGLPRPEGENQPTNTRSRQNSYESALTFGRTSPFARSPGNEDSGGDQEATSLLFKKVESKELQPGSEEESSRRPRASPVTTQRDENRQQRHDVQAPSFPPRASPSSAAVPMSTTSPSTELVGTNAMQRVTRRLDELTQRLDLVRVQERDLKDKVDRVAQAQQDLSKVRQDAIGSVAKGSGPPGTSSGASERSRDDTPALSDATAKKLAEFEKSNLELVKKVEAYHAELNGIKAALENAENEEELLPLSCSGLEDADGAGLAKKRSTTAASTTSSDDTAPGIASLKEESSQQRADALAIANAVAAKKERRVLAFVDELTQSRLNSLEADLLARIQFVENDLGNRIVQQKDEVAQVQTEVKTLTEQKSSSSADEDGSHERHASNAAVSPEDGDAVMKFSSLVGPKAAGKSVSKGADPSEVSPSREERAESRRKILANQLGPVIVEQNLPHLEKEIDDKVAKRLEEHKQHFSSEIMQKNKRGNEEQTHQFAEKWSAEQKQVERALQTLRERVDTIETSTSARIQATEEENVVWKKESNLLHDRITNLSEKMDSALVQVNKAVKDSTTSSDHRDDGVLEVKLMQKITSNYEDRMTKSVKSSEEQMMKKCEKQFAMKHDLKSMESNLERSVLAKTKEQLIPKIVPEIVKKDEIKQLVAREVLKTRKETASEAEETAKRSMSTEVDKLRKKLNEDLFSSKNLQDFLQKEVSRIVQEELAEVEIAKRKEEEDTERQRQRATAAPGATSSKSSPSQTQTARTNKAGTTPETNPNKNHSSPTSRSRRSSPLLSPRSELLSLQSRLARVQGMLFEARGMQPPDSPPSDESKASPEVQRRIEKDMTIDDLILQMEQGTLFAGSASAIDLDDQQSTTKFSPLRVDGETKTKSQSKKHRRTSFSALDDEDENGENTEVFLPSFEDLAKQAQSFSSTTRSRSPQLLRDRVVSSSSPRSIRAAIAHCDKSEEALELLRTTLMNSERQASSPSRTARVGDEQTSRTSRDRRAPPRKASGDHSSSSASSTEKAATKTKNPFAAAFDNFDILQSLEDEGTVAEQDKTLAGGSAASSTRANNSYEERTPGNVLQDLYQKPLSPSSGTKKMQQAKVVVKPSEQDDEQFRSQVEQTSLNATELREELDQLKAQLSAWRTQQMDEVLKFHTGGKNGGKSKLLKTPDVDEDDSDDFCSRGPSSLNPMARAAAASRAGGTQTSDVENVDPRRPRNSGGGTTSSRVSGNKNNNFSPPDRGMIFSSGGKMSSARRGNSSTSGVKNKSVSRVDAALGKNQNGTKKQGAAAAYTTPSESEERAAKKKTRLERALRMLESDEIDKPKKLFRRTGLF